MAEIIALLTRISQTVSRTELRQLMVIVPAVLAMSGGVTMLNISRWTGKGGSYGTVRRFYNAPIKWLQVNWALSRAQLEETKGIYLLVGDETVVTKAGKETHEVSRFFSSIYRRVVPGLSFFGVSLVSVEAEQSTMMLMEQLSKAETTTQKRPKNKHKSKGKTSAKKKPKQKGGRPKGSRNKNRRDVELPMYLQNIQAHFKQVLDVVQDTLTIPYCVLDGAFGNNNALQMVRHLDLDLISKLAKNSALYFPYDGVQKKVGQRRKYGAKLDYQQIPDRYRKERSFEDGIYTDIYQMQMWSKNFPDLLNIVVIVKTNITTQQRAHVVLFSSDLTLAHDKLIHYYRLRFQIEFNFRDAKQFWGLEDFMNVKQKPVHNAANFALFMTNLASLILHQRRTYSHSPNFSVNDLKAEQRGRFYSEKVLKLFSEMPDSTFIDALFSTLSSVGAVNLGVS